MIAGMPLYQNDPRLRTEPSIAPYGCYVTVLREIVERHYERVLGPETWLVVYRHAVQLGNVQDNNKLRAYVLKPIRLINAVKDVLDISTPTRYVLRRSVAGYDEHDFDTGETPNAWIARARIENARISHFYEIFEDGDCAWDPLWPTRRKIETLSIRGLVI